MPPPAYTTHTAHLDLLIHYCGIVENETKLVSYVVNTGALIRQACGED
jgi:hypothetical protein